LDAVVPTAGWAALIEDITLDISAGSLDICLTGPAVADIPMTIASSAMIM
jgi:hypothetical protein